MSRQWVHHIINRYKQSGTIPVLFKPGRKTKGIRVLDSPPVRNTILFLEMGFTRYEISLEIHIGHGTQFWSACKRDLDHQTFKEFLDGHGIRYILARVKNPQTNGKIERFFGEVVRRIN